MGFRGSKRSSISFGTFQRQPNDYITGEYDGEFVPIQSTNFGSANGSNVSSSLGGSNGAGSNGIASRSPMYSPIQCPLYDYQQPSYSPGYSPFHMLRSPGSSGVTTVPVCEYGAKCPLFGLDWSNDDFVCLGSYKDDGVNSLEVIHSGDLISWNKIASCNVTFPVSTMQWQPAILHPRRFATCSDSLRLWNFSQEEGSLHEQINLSLCKHTRQQQGTSRSNNGNVGGIGELPPITSLHWNAVDPNLLISSSIDTTCIVWDLQSSNYVRTQLIAHDSEVFDVRFLTQTTQLFASCGGDGSVRVFDLRCLAHSTIIYERAASSEVGNLPVPSSNTVAPSLSEVSEANLALLRLEPSPFDPNIIATFAIDSTKVLILDMRSPGSPVLVLQGHSAAVNQIKWHPSKRNILLSCADDCQVFYWDLDSHILGYPTDRQEHDPLMDPSQQHNSAAASKWNSKKLLQTLDTPSTFYTNSGQEINNVVWRPQGGDWFGSVAGKMFQNVKL